MDMKTTSAVLAASASLMLVAACGGTTTAGNQPAGPSGSPASGTQPSPSGAGDLSGFASSVQHGATATFKAVYTSTGSSGTSQTITLEQAPPKQLFRTDSSGSSSEFLNTGSKSYSCSSGGSGSAPMCTSLGSAGSGALTGMLSFYNGTAAMGVMQGWQAAVASHLAGVSLTFSDDTIAGQAVRCAHWSANGETATYCVTSQGVLAKVAQSGGASSGSSFVLKSYSTSAPDSDFALPAGAKTVGPTG